MTALGLDTFNTGGRGTPNAISPASDGQNWVQLSSQGGTLGFTGTEGTFTGATAKVAWGLGSTSGKNFEMQVRISASANADIVGFVMRYTGGNNFYNVHFSNTGTAIARTVNGATTTLGSFTSTFTHGTFYWIHASMVDAPNATPAGVYLAMNAWQDGTTEPLGWQINVFDSTPLTTAGPFGLYFNLNATTDTATFDNFSCYDFRMADSASVNDSGSFIYDTTPGLIDSLATVDATTFTAIPVLVESSSLGLSDSVTYQRTLVAVDTIATQDSIIGQNTVAFSDALTTVDGTTFTNAANMFDATSFNLTDNANYQSTLLAIEALSSNETMVFLANLTFTDALPIADSGNNTAAYAVTEPLTVTESMVWQEQGVFLEPLATLENSVYSDAVNLSESIPVSENVQYASVFFAPESLIAVDSSFYTLIFTVEDALQALDVLLSSDNATILDTTSFMVSDSATYNTVFTPVESLPIQEYIAYLLNSSYSESVLPVDATTFSNTLSVIEPLISFDSTMVATVFVPIATLNQSDSFTVTLQGDMGDTSLTISDALAQATFFTIQEVVLLVESFVWNEQSAWTDTSMTVSDSLFVQGNSVLVEPPTMTDSLLVINLYSTEDDSLAVHDGAFYGPTFVPMETIAASDSGTYVLSVFLTENMASTTLVGSTLFWAVTDTTEALDSLSAMLTYLVTDSLSVASLSAFTSNPQLGDFLSVADSALYLNSVVFTAMAAAFDGTFFVTNSAWQDALTATDSATYLVVVQLGGPLAITDTWLALAQYVAQDTLAVADSITGAKMVLFVDSLSASDSWSLSVITSMLFYGIVFDGIFNATVE